MSAPISSRSLFLRKLIRLYQIVLSPLFAPACRFHPSCSQYADEALERHGPGQGSWLALKRILRCGPWHPGGFDPVPVPGARQKRFSS